MITRGHVAANSHGDKVTKYQRINETMSTALTKASGRAVSNYDGDPFGAQGSEGAGGNINYVKFTGATGQFTYGQDDDVLEHDTELVVDMMNAEFIWTFWWDGEVLESFTEKLVDNPLSYDNPPDYLPENDDINMSLAEIEEAREKDPSNFRDGWSVQASFNGRPLDGSDETFCIKLNKGVALNSFHTLRKNFGKQRALKEGQLPVVTVSADSYKPKAKSAGNKRWAPSFKIGRWMTDEEIASAIGENPEDYDNDEGQAQVEDKSADTAEAEEKKPVASGRRGRRGARGSNMG